MNVQLLWLWLWFGIGISVYMLKRAYYLVTGPNPVANNYHDFIVRCWIPLLVRTVVDSGVYWASFYPDLVNPVFRYLGMNFQLHSALPEYAVVALFFGLGVDSLVDFAVTKIPYVKDWLPQMPPPLPQKAIVQTALVETKVTSVETTTNVVQGKKEGE